MPVAETGLITVPGCRDKEGHLIVFVRPRLLDWDRYEVRDVVRRPTLLLPLVTRLGPLVPIRVGCLPPL